jgi:anti-anti-sigma regulatory factor
VGPVSESDTEGQQGGSFSYSVQRLPAATSIVYATGVLDGKTRAVMFRAIAAELTLEPAQLVLELSGATSVDDAAVETLVGATALAAESDTSFCLVMSPNGPVARALAAADLLERFEIFATVDEAQRHR